MILDSDKDIDALLAKSKRIAVLGIKTSEKASAPAYHVPEYMQQQGLSVVPVPVYYPEVSEILGEKIYRQVADVPGAIDIVDVFRRPEDIPAHLADIIAKHPRAVWFQLGIRNDAAAKALSDAGIDVVQDRCLRVEWQRFRAAH